MWCFSICTIGALLAVSWAVVRLDRMHGKRVTVTAAAMTRMRVSVPAVSDSPAGLSYDMLGPPWRSGCPASLTTQTFTWTSGEATVAGYVRDAAAGQSVTWYGSACAGPLPAQFSGLGLHGEANAVLRAIGPVYYGAVRHTVRVASSQAVKVGGRPAWRLLFQVTYPGARLPWTVERGAIIVVGRGAGELYYVSVPGNLGSWTYPALVFSLR